MSTVLLVKARRFRCKHCVRTFSESLAGIAPHYGRKKQKVLDRISSVSLKTTSHTTAIGIDDAAQKEGHTYMSVVVNQHSHQIIALLDCCSGEELDSY